MSSHAYPDCERIRSSSFVSGKTFPAEARVLEIEVNSQPTL